jgi:hypothetical protein
MDTTDIRTEMDRVRADFRGLVYSATVRELRRHTAGTKWTNEHCSSTWSSATCWSGTSSSWYAACPGSQTKPPAVSPPPSTPSTRRDPRPRLPAYRAAHGPNHRRPADIARPLLRRRAPPIHALPRPLGPVLRRRHDHPRRLPLPHPALRPPPTAHPPPHRRRRLTGRSQNERETAYDSRPKRTFAVGAEAVRPPADACVRSLPGRLVGGRHG